MANCSEPGVQVPTGLLRMRPLLRPTQLHQLGPPPPPAWGLTASADIPANIKIGTGEEQVKRALQLQLAEVLIALHYKLVGGKPNRRPRMLGCEAIGGEAIAGIVPCCRTM